MIPAELDHDILAFTADRLRLLRCRRGRRRGPPRFRGGTTRRFWFVIFASVVAESSAAQDLSASSGLLPRRHRRFSSQII